MQIPYKSLCISEVCMVMQLCYHSLLKENSELKSEINEIKVTKYLLISKYPLAFLRIQPKNFKVYQLFYLLLFSHTVSLSNIKIRLTSIKIIFFILYICYHIINILLFICLGNCCDF